LLDKGILQHRAYEPRKPLVKVIRHIGDKIFELLATSFLRTGQKNRASFGLFGTAAALCEHLSRLR